ncbi:hypothetical protein O0L34_g460 [Tuta absoluta]|nr:hypothetical protein O0L34_g460 [Tuta absoluta]
MQNTYPQARPSLRSFGSYQPSSISKGRRLLSQGEPDFLQELKSNKSRLTKSSAEVLADHYITQFKKWENVSKLNLYQRIAPTADLTCSTRSSTSTQRRATVFQQTEPCMENFLVDRAAAKEDDALTEKFAINVTTLMNEDNLWGCFYNFPELYNDEYSPVVRVGSLQAGPEMVGGVLTRDVISTCLTYLKRIPILGDYVYIKLDLSNKHIANIEVLQHYKYLVYLDLSSNYLTELTVLSRLLYLQYLSVSFNRLSTVLEYEVPQWFLTEVHYKYNSVQRIRDLSMFWSITVLDLSHNNIKTITGLDNLPYLRRLDLSFNHIQRLENLKNLNVLWLDLSYNNISSFEFGATTGLWTLHHLEYLNLNENNLTSMKLFSGCTRLQELLVRNNRLSVLLELAVYMRQMRRLIVLDLRANPVCFSPGYREVCVNTFPILLNLDDEELDPVEQRDLIMDVYPDVNMFASRRLLRLMYIEQLSRARVSPYIPPADTTDVPIIIFVGYEAVGKGTLARRLTEKCSSNIELAIQHTTCCNHSPGYYKEVSRSKFDDMLLAGEFLTYTEMDGESYGLSREQAFVRDGKVRLACMDLTSALMMKLRGFQPYLILTTCADKLQMMKRQLQRKELRSREFQGKTSIDVPIEKSTLQVLVSGRILVTGILNEILLTLPEEKDASEFVMDSSCSLMMESQARHAVQQFSRQFHMLEMMTSSQTSMENACQKFKNQKDAISLTSLYKDSQQGTDEFADCERSYQVSKWSNVDPHKHGGNSTKSSKSVTFNSQETSDVSSRGLTRDKDETLQDNLTGLLVEVDSKKPEDVPTERKPMVSVSNKFKTMAGRPQHGTGRNYSSCSFDDNDLWLSFLFNTGLLQGSHTDVETSEMLLRHETRVDDPDYILRQLAVYKTVAGLIPSVAHTTNIRDDYDDVHRQRPGLFFDTITMDDPDAAFKKAKKIIKGIVESQKHLKPMFDIDFGKMADECPLIQNTVHSVAKFIAQQRFFF